MLARVVVIALAVALTAAPVGAAQDAPQRISDQRAYDVVSYGGAVSWLVGSGGGDPRRILWWRGRSRTLAVGTGLLDIAPDRRGRPVALLTRCSPLGLCPLVGQPVAGGRPRTVAPRSPSWAAAWKGRLALSRGGVLDVVDPGRRPRRIAGPDVRDVDIGRRWVVYLQARDDRTVIAARSSRGRRATVLAVGQPIADSCRCWSSYRTVANPRLSGDFAYWLERSGNETQAHSFVYRADLRRPAARPAVAELDPGAESIAVDHGVVLYTGRAGSPQQGVYLIRRPSWRLAPLAPKTS